MTPNTKSAEAAATLSDGLRQAAADEAFARMKHARLIHDDRLTEELAEVWIVLEQAAHLARDLRSCALFVFGDAIRPA